MTTTSSYVPQAMAIARSVRELRLAPDALGAGPRPLSSHGLGIAEALELASTLYGTALADRVEIVGVAITRPAGSAFGLSPAVAAAVEPAAALAAALAGAHYT